MQKLPEPKKPQVYKMLMRQRAHGMGWNAGGLSDQPAEMMREFDVIVTAERRFKRTVLPLLKQKFPTEPAE